MIYCFPSAGVVGPEDFLVFCDKAGFLGIQRIVKLRLQGTVPRVSPQFKNMQTDIIGYNSSVERKYYLSFPVSGGAWS